MSTPVSYREDAKRAAQDQWNADPCGPSTTAELGSAANADQLLAGRRDYGPWFPEGLDYAGARGQRVLDLGCGQGIDLMEYALAGALPTGIDLTPRHVELARLHLAAKGLEAEVVQGDVERLPFDDGSFDRLSSNGVLHHTPDMPAALREAHRVLRPGGEARIIVYNRLSLHYWGQQVLMIGLLQGALLKERSMEGVLSRGVELSSIDARPLVRVYSPRRLKQMMRSAGFDDVQAIVRHMNPTDAPLVGRLPESTRERLGRRVGWYVVGRGVRR